MTNSRHPEPPACSLDDAGLQARRSEFQESLAPYLQEMTRLASGLRLVFPEDEELRKRVEALVAKERQCCGFLTFQLSTPGNAPTLMALTITGPADAAETIEMLASALEGS